MATIHDIWVGDTTTPNPSTSLLQVAEYNLPFAVNSGSQYPFGGRFDRGLIVQTAASSGKNARYGVRFMYNPSVLSFSYSLSTAMPANQMSAAEAGTNNLMFSSTGRTVGFDLLFDRTIEVARKNGSEAGNKGVYHDVRYLERVVGIEEEGAPLLMTMAEVYFGSYNAPKFKGYVQGMDITYTHFADGMIPTRCVVNLTILQIYDPPPLPPGTFDMADGNPNMPRRPGQQGLPGTIRPM